MRRLWSLRSLLRWPARSQTRLRFRLASGLQLFAFLGILGPGLIAANAGNDAGGIATYSDVGAKYGYGLLWVIVLITISLAIIQAHAARMGCVTGKGLSELIRENYGIRWSALATTAILIANTGVCITEFVGIGAAFSLAGIPAQVTVPIAAIVVWLIIVRGSYGTAERIFVLMTLPFFAYPVAAFLGHPHWTEVSKAIVMPHVSLNKEYLLLIIALAGTTITPYMQLYLQSAVVERGSGEEQVRHETTEAALGSVFSNVIAAFIVIATGATLFRHGIHSIDSAAQAAQALAPFAGEYAETLFAIGLLGASLLAAAILPIATSYAVSESLGLEKGISRTPSEAPVFVGIITAMIVISTIVAIIPGIPIIALLVGVQVVNGLLLPINLIFMWRLSRSGELMGRHRSRGVLNGATAVTVLITSALSITLVVITVFGF